MIDKQSFFDKTVAHLRQQGRRSFGYSAVVGDEICLYRCHVGDEVLKCAAGFHIPDSLYEPAMEDKGIGAVLRDFPELSEYFPDDNEFLQSLQSAHDTAGDKLEYLEGNLEVVATRYGLIYTPPAVKG